MLIFFFSFVKMLHGPPTEHLPPSGMAKQAPGAVSAVAGSSTSESSPGSGSPRLCVSQ